MKTKTSVTLSTELIATIDNWTGETLNRSSFLERAAWQYIARLRREKRDVEDLKIINQHADELNANALDVLSYQADV